MDRQQRALKWSVARGTAWRLEQIISKEDFEDCAHSDLTLRFPEQSPFYKTAQALIQSLIDTVAKEPVPEGLAPIIASGRKRESVSRRNVETLLANIFNMELKHKLTLSVSLSPQTYSNTKLSSGYINLVKLLAHFDHGLLVLWKGFRGKYTSRLARIRPTKKFWGWRNGVIDELMAGGSEKLRLPCEDDIISSPHDLIELRRTVRTRHGKEKISVHRKQWEKQITPERAEHLEEIRKGLCCFNTVFDGYDITYTDGKTGRIRRLYPRLKAVYNEDFEHGGRFYTGKGGHQGLHKSDRPRKKERAERPTIRFNGHPTIELDYDGLHIRMLYHMAGKAYPLNGDPYIDVFEQLGINIDKLKASGEYGDIRGDLKAVLFALVNGTIDNSKNPLKQTIDRAEFRLFNSWVQKRGIDARTEAKQECDERKRRWQKAGLLDSKGKPSKVIKAFRKAHAPIKEIFYSGCGLELQNIDATIAYQVMTEMMLGDYEVLTLPVHDSFITFLKYRNRLKKTMEMVYERVMQQVTNTKRSFRIKVKPPETTR